MYGDRPPVGMKLEHAQPAVASVSFPASSFGLCVEHHLVYAASRAVLVRAEAYVSPVAHVVHDMAAQYHRRVSRGLDQFPPQRVSERDVGQGGVVVLRDQAVAEHFRVHVAVSEPDDPVVAVLGTRDQFAGGLYDRAARLKFERYDQIVLARRRLELVPCVLDRLDARRILEHAGQQLGVPAVAVGREIGVQLAVPVLGAFVAVIVVAGAQNVGNRVVEHAERARDGLPLFGRRLVAGPAVASRHGPEILLDHVARAEHQTDIQPLDVIPDPARHHFQQRLVVAVLDIGLRVR